MYVTYIYDIPGISIYDIPGILYLVYTYPISPIQSAAYDCLTAVLVGVLLL